MRSAWRLFEKLLVIFLALLMGLIGAATAAAGSFIILGWVAGSFILRRYETGNAPSYGAHSDGISSSSRIPGILGEAAAAFICVMLYPFGYLDPADRQFLVGERPLILCHGYMTNRSSLLWLGRQLKKDGRRNIIIPNFRPRTATIPEFAADLAAIVTRALERTGADKVDLVGHSMGGLVVRYYVERLGGAPLVRTAITIGSPHGGTKTAVLSLFRTGLQFCTHSGVIDELRCCAPTGVKMVSIWSEFDNIVLPPENALLPHPRRNVMVRNVGHIALLFSRQVLTEVRLALSDTGNT